MMKIVMKTVMPTVTFTVMAAVLVFGYSNCGSGGFKPMDLRSSIYASVNGKNSIGIGVGTCKHINQPCISVTICKPGTTNCQTIDDVLLDTGSYGLRLFTQVVSLPLDQVKAANGQSIGECMPYAGGSTQWGPLKYADVRLGEEVAANIPIQVIDVHFGTVPAADCANNDTDPSVGFNGILGVGQFVRDCGSRCVSDAANKVYYTCNGATCTSAAVPLDLQVPNPVAMFPVDNNGIVISMPEVPADGAISVNGTLSFGIGTQSNNKPGNVTMLPADQLGNFKTVLNGTTYATAFIDSGSNGIFFPSSTIAECSKAKGFYCPPSTLSLTATQMGATGNAQKTVSFDVINADSMLDNPNYVFDNLAGKIPTNDFDWGLPFFLGRTIYIGIEGRQSTLGAGPYWAY